MKPINESLQEQLRQVKAASAQMFRLSDDQVRVLLADLAERLLTHGDDWLQANRLDLERMARDNPKYDRLLLDEQRITGIADDLRRVAGLPTPVGEVLEQRRLDNGLELSKVRVPLGVVAVIYESRPNVTVDVVGLCLKSGNACVLKGSRDAEDSNRYVVGLIHDCLRDHGLNPDWVYLAPAERSALAPILNAVGLIDVAIPRGSQGLIDAVREQARIPVIETGAGICHTYVDASADCAMAQAIVTNAKARRVSVCNALDTLLIHRDKLTELPAILHDLGERHQVRVYADEAALAVLQGHYAGPLQAATEEDYGREFLDYQMAVRTVDDLDQALAHIRRYSSQHSEAIVAGDHSVQEMFLNAVDAAAVYVNASTAFTDGGQFGLGAEIGISTQKLHARGPMGLAELTSYQWRIRGQGQIRE
ncbi:MAG: glutamate-5-semialdehyde dehydrogenase [Wenzhouxiangellaceae bacterium]